MNAGRQTSLTTSAVRDWLVDRGEEATAVTMMRALRSQEATVGTSQALILLETLRSELSGAGPLQNLIKTRSVTDVLVNGSGQVWVDDGHGLRAVASPFETDEQVRRLAQRLAAAAGRRLDDSMPFCDAKLPDGTRLHACLSPVSRPGCLISLRIPNRGSLTLDDLATTGSVPAAALPWLRALIASRVSFLVSGGTGSGKTTVLGILLGLLPQHERLVILEDSAELNPDHLHTCALEGRPSNVEGSGRIALSDLVRQAMRMRPDRLVVGEVRGPEVVDLLSALNTGHEGGACTVHASSAASVPQRLEALAMTAGLDRYAAHAHIAGGLDVVVHLRRTLRAREITGLAGLERDTDGLCHVRPLVTFADGVTVQDEEHDVVKRLRDHL